MWAVQISGRIFRDQNLSSLRSAAQSGPEIDRISDYCKIHPILAPHRTHHHLTGVDADTDTDVFASRCGHLTHRELNFSSAFHRPPHHLFTLKYRHEFVPDKLVD